jgi:hypothetical protein
MSSEIILNIIACDKIMMIFNMSTSYFHKISFHYFEDYLMMMKLTDLRVRYQKQNFVPNVCTG